MSNIVTVNSGSAINGSLKAGRVSISTDSSITPSSGGKTWYNMINPAEGYVFISDPKVQGYNDGPPIIYPTQTSLPADILATVNGLPDRRGSVPFDNVWDALVWVQSTGKYFVLDKTLSGQVSDNLNINIDANNISSYPQSGSTIYDLSGKSINGVLTNGPTFNPKGWIEFDGTDDYVNFGNPTELNFTGDMSHEIWFTRNSNAITNLRLTAKGAGGSSIGQKGFSFFGSDNSIRWAVNVGGVRDIINATITTDRWYHVVGTADLTNSTQSIYLNGEFVGQQPITGTGDMVASNDFLVGSYFGLANYFWDGKVGSTKVYSKALSLGDVKQNYYGAPIVTDNLAYKWDAGNLVSYDKSGTTTYNLAGSISGSLENGVAFNNPNGGTWEFDGSNDRIVLESSITPGNGN